MISSADGKSTSGTVIGGTSQSLDFSFDVEVKVGKLSAMLDIPVFAKIDDKYYLFEKASDYKAKDMEKAFLLTREEVSADNAATAKGKSN